MATEQERRVMEEVVEDTIPTPKSYIKRLEAVAQAARAIMGSGYSRLANSDTVSVAWGGWVALVDAISKLDEEE